MVGADPLKTHPVAGCYILRARTRNRTRLLVIEPRQNDLGIRADLWLRPTENGMETVINTLTGLIAGKRKRTGKSRKGTSVGGAARAAGLDAALMEQAADMLKGVHKVVVVYGDGILNKKDPKLVASLLELASLVNPDGPKVVSLKPRANSRGAWELGAASLQRMAKAIPRLVYILQGDDEFEAEDWVAQAEEAEFLIVQASYASPLTEAADLVLPSPIWAERTGTYISLDGKAGRSQVVLEPPPGLKDDCEILKELARRL